MKIAIGCDHAGYALKGSVLAVLQDRGDEVVDMGCFSEASVDYPDYALAVAKAVASGECERGILVCGTGIGMSIAANKLPGIRAALCHDTFSAHATREHNDSNILCMGQRVVGPGLAEDILRIWLATDFMGGKHQRRIDKIAAIGGEK